MAIAAGCLWLITANVLAMLPSRSRHWRAAWVLIATGLPLLGWIVVQQGWIWGAMFLAGGASVLRWPLVFLVRWVRGR